LEVAVAVVENRWPDLPGSLPGFRAWLQPSETKEISIINHIALLSILEDTPLRYVVHIFHSTNSFQKIKILDKMIKYKAYVTSQILVVLNIAHPKDPYIGHLYYNKWHKV
jgi:hypothetical protein